MLEFSLASKYIRNEQSTFADCTKPRVIAPLQFPLVCARTSYDSILNLLKKVNFSPSVLSISIASILSAFRTLISLVITIIIIIPTYLCKFINNKTSNQEFPFPNTSLARNSCHSLPVPLDSQGLEALLQVGRTPLHLTEPAPTQITEQHQPASVLHNRQPVRRNSSHLTSQSLLKVSIQPASPEDSPLHFLVDISLVDIRQIQSYLALLMPHTTSRFGNPMDIERCSQNGINITLDAQSAQRTLLSTSYSIDVASNSQPNMSSSTTQPPTTPVPSDSQDSAAFLQVASTPLYASQERSVDTTSFSQQQQTAEPQIRKKMLSIAITTLETVSTISQILKAL